MALENIFNIEIKRVLDIYVLEILYIFSYKWRVQIRYVNQNTSEIERESY